MLARTEISFRDQVRNPHWTQLGAFNAVMAGRHAVGAEGSHVTDFEGPLSLKTVISGHAVWTTDRTVRRVNEGFGLILNRGQAYSLDMAPDEPVETFCPFFAAGFVEGVAFALSRDATRRLDEPDGETPVAFPQRLAAPGEHLAAATADLRACLARTDLTELMWDGAFHDLAAALLEARPDLLTGLAPAHVRPAARTEVTRRLARALDYMHAHAEDSLTLTRIAGIAALSPHHFHRAFRRALGTTPHAYLRDLRLSRAERLLRRTDMPVTQVCLAVGFESLGSFSSAFSASRGLSPSAWRAANSARSEKAASPSLR